MVLTLSDTLPHPLPALPLCTESTLPSTLTVTYPIQQNTIPCIQSTLPCTLPMPPSPPLPPPQELRLDGNMLRRVPSEALRGPTALQNLHLEDNAIGQYCLSALPCPVLPVRTALSCTVLYCLVLYCLSCTALSCTALSALPCPVLPVRTALSCIALSCTALSYTVPSYT